MMPKAALALLLCVASSDAWFLYKAPGGVEFNASGHRSQYLALASRTVGVKGRVVAGLSDASRYFSVLAGGGKGDRRNSKPVVLARGGQWPHADPSVAVAWTGCRTLDMRDGCLAPILVAAARGGRDGPGRALAVLPPRPPAQRRVAPHPPEVPAHGEGGGGPLRARGQRRGLVFLGLERRERGGDGRLAPPRLAPRRGAHGSARATTCCPRWRRCTRHTFSGLTGW